MVTFIKNFLMLIFICIFFPGCASAETAETFQRKTLKLIVDSMPTGAQISVDGEHIGSAPATAEIICDKSRVYGGSIFHSPMGSRDIFVEAVDNEGRVQKTRLSSDATCIKQDGSTVKVFFNMKRRVAPTEEKIDLKIKNE